MPRRSSPLHTGLDRLIQDFVDAVLVAVRDASLRELAAGLSTTSRPTPSVRRPRAAAAPKLRRAPPSLRPAPAPRSPPAPRRRRPAVRADEAREPEFDIAITDPAALLAAAAAEPSPRPAPRAATALLEPVAPPRPAPVRAPEPPRPTVEPRAGEDLLRSAGGGLVIRRRPPARSR